MYYFTLNNDELERQEVEALPKDLEELYQEIRKKYIIRYENFDWADDDRDAGMGYCYDNSYCINREPSRKELLIKDGEFAGFYVSYLDGFPFKQELNKGNILNLQDQARVYHSGTYSQFYGDSKSWILKIEDEPKPADYVFLHYVSEPNYDRLFVPADFDMDLIESIDKIDIIEDSRGRFNDAFRIRLKLTPEGIANPDRVLEVLAKYSPVLIKK